MTPSDRPTDRTHHRGVIRQAAGADVPRLVAMGERFITETGYHALLPVNAAQITALMQDLVSGSASSILVLERDGALIGMIGLYAFRHPISGEAVASEVFWWVEPEARGGGLRLLTAAEAWAAAQGAVLLQMIAPTPAVERIYTRRGYVPVERLYQRRVA